MNKTTASALRYGLLAPLLILVAGCQILEPLEKLGSAQAHSNVTEIKPQVVEINQLILWLQTANELSQVTPEQALDGLHRLGPRPVGHLNRFRYALFNQQLGDRTGWVRARDTLRELVVDSDLSPDLERLARIMQAHNQAMINAESRQHQMARELDAAQLAQRDLQEKIKALTHLEQHISIRKEMAVDETVREEE